MLKAAYLQKITILLAISFFISCSSAFAEFKVAFVDVAKVLNDSKEAKTERATLDSKSKEIKEKLENRRNELKALEKSIREKGLNEDAKEVEQWRAQARAFEVMVREADEDLRKDYMKVNRALSEKTLKIISDYSKKNSFDLVVDKGEAGRGPVLYGESSLDITSDIVSLMND
jgi:Skp family chaperone for outer membrane proteins